MRAPMETRLQKFVEPARLAARGDTLEGTLPSSAVTRLGKQFQSGDAVQVKLRFVPADRGRIKVIGTLETSLQAVCQRCLEPVEVQIEQDIAVELVDVAALGNGSTTGADEFDDAVEYQGKLNLYELIEDELVLACPIVPQHERGECANPAFDAEGQSGQVSAEPAAESNSAGDTRKPFADLAQLLDESTKNDTD